MRDLVGVSISLGSAHNIYQEAVWPPITIATAAPGPSICSPRRPGAASGLQDCRRRFGTARGPKNGVARATVPRRCVPYPAWFETPVKIWTRIASGLRSSSQALEARPINPHRCCQGSLLLTKLAELGQSEAQPTLLASDLRTFDRWLEREVLSLGGPDWAGRRELFDFIADELHRHGYENPPSIGATTYHRATISTGSKPGPVCCSFSSTPGVSCATGATSAAAIAAPCIAPKN